jgi:hypothetical protein
MPNIVLARVCSIKIFLYNRSINRTLHFIHQYRPCVLIIIVWKQLLSVCPNAFLRSSLFVLLHSSLNRFVFYSGKNGHEVKGYIELILALSLHEFEFLLPDAQCLTAHFHLKAVLALLFTFQSNLIASTDISF